MKYLSIGGFAVDSVINAEGEEQLCRFGGNAAYGSAGMRIWASGQVGVIGRVGRDYPQQWLELTRQAEIDTSGVVVTDSPHTLIGGMIYDRSGTRRERVSIKEFTKTGAGLPEFPDYLASAVEGGVYHPPAVEERALLSARQRIPPGYSNVQAILISPQEYEYQLMYARYFRENVPGCTIALDAIRSSLVPAKRAQLMEILCCVDVFLPSEAEIFAMFGGIEPEEAAKRIAAMGVKTVVVKLGARGCLLYRPEEGLMKRIPAYPARVVDPTGAGDSFAGGFLVGLSESGDIVRAALYGTVSASFAIEGFGAEYSYSVTRSMAKRRLSAMEKMMEC